MQGPPKMTLFLRSSSGSPSTHSSAGPSPITASSKAAAVAVEGPERGIGEAAWITTKGGWSAKPLALAERRVATSSMDTGSYARLRVPTTHSSSSDLRGASSRSSTHSIHRLRHPVGARCMRYRAAGEEEEEKEEEEDRPKSSEIWRQMTTSLWGLWNGPAPQQPIPPAVPSPSTHLPSSPLSK